MIKIYECIYIRVTDLYKKWGEKEKSANTYALCVITLLQVFNLFSLIIGGVLLHLVNPASINKYYLYFLAIIMYGVNYWWIDKRKSKIEEDINNSLVRKLTLAYVVISFTVFLTLFLFRMLS